MAWPIRLTWSCGAWPKRLIRAHTAIRGSVRSYSAGDKINLHLGELAKEAN